MDWHSSQSIFELVTMIRVRYLVSDCWPVDYVRVSKLKDFFFIYFAFSYGNQIQRGKYEGESESCLLLWMYKRNLNSRSIYLSRTNIHIRNCTEISVFTCYVMTSIKLNSNRSTRFFLFQSSFAELWLNIRFHIFLSNALRFTSSFSVHERKGDKRNLSPYYSCYLPRYLRGLSLFLFPSFRSCCFL